MQPRTSNAKQFFCVAIFVGLVAAGGAWALIALVQPPPEIGSTGIPNAFWFSSIFLFLTSVSLQFGLDAVTREKQPKFRKAMTIALCFALAFLSTQSLAIYQLIVRQNPEQVSVDANGFVLTFAALHAMHVTLAMLVLVYVTVEGFSYRYDHEYHWGVTACTWFWHGLGIAWCFILAAIVISLYDS